MTNYTQTSNLPEPPPPPPGGGAPDGSPGAADPPRLPFWRRGSRRPTAPPPPIWELPELDPPGLWTRLKQRADHWLSQSIAPRGTDARTPNESARPAAPTSGQEPRPARANVRREDTAVVRPPAVGAFAERPPARQPTAASDPAEDSEDAASPPISAAVLESAYEDVRQGRIGDPATIRAIADRLARITPDAAMSDDLAFDPRDAVRALRQRASEIAQARGLDDSGDDEQDRASGSSPARGSDTNAPRTAPRRPAPQIERDENITRGG
ncbi:MAG TPA: hypothetical protein VIG30_17310 [Ktedonobacterales bacterium]|jgi:hypothetical protein